MSGSDIWCSIVLIIIVIIIVSAIVSLYDTTPDPGWEFVWDDDEARDSVPTDYEAQLKTRKKVTTYAEEFKSSTEQAQGGVRNPKRNSVSTNQNLYSGALNDPSGRKASKRVD